jgi:U4/U6.U5 tri-snRNP-associated protein 1
MAESLSVEAVNQMRVAMGMKPIPVPGAPEGPTFKSKDAGPEEDIGSTYETREAAADDNWAKLQAEQKAKEDRQKKKEQIKKARDAAERNKKFTGKGLADVEEDVDTMSWLKSQSKRVKRLEKEQKEAEEREAAKKKAEYTAADLAGVKVGHELGEFDAGSEQILVLKDAEIGEEEEDDELENVDLRDKEKLNERLESKKRKPVYNPNDVDENGEKSLLSQYDDVDGKKPTRFTLDGQGSTVEALSRKEDAEERSKGLLISLDMLKEDKPVSDYKDISEIKIRKPKKGKKSKSTRKRAADDDDIFPVAAEADAMDVDTGATNGVAPKKKRTLDDTTFDDDEDLQAELARQRREALKKRKKTRPEDLAKQMREEEEATMDGIIDSVEQDDGGLIIDETTEFVQNLRPAHEEEEEAKERKRKSSVPASHTPPGEPDVEGDTDMQESYGAAQDAEDAAERAQRATSSVAPDEATTTGLEAEGTLNQGVAGTLNMLRQRGLIKETHASETQGSFEDRQKFLRERQKREEEAERKARLQRERDRTSGRLDRMSAREREDYARANNTNREQAESRQLADMFNREYKPTVDLKYIDEFGRSMDQKEAFKHLSHQFHGKGSGKQKHEKRLKKIEDEKKREAMSTLDSSQHGSSSAMGDKAKRSKQAGVRLQ